MNKTPVNIDIAINKFCAGVQLPVRGNFFRRLVVIGLLLAVTLLVVAVAGFSPVGIEAADAAKFAHTTDHHKHFAEALKVLRQHPDAQKPKEQQSQQFKQQCESAKRCLPQFLSTLGEDLQNAEGRKALINYDPLLVKPPEGEGENWIYNPGDQQVTLYEADLPFQNPYKVDSFVKLPGMKQVVIEQKKADNKRKRQEAWAEVKNAFKVTKEKVFTAFAVFNTVAIATVIGVEILYPPEIWSAFWPGFDKEYGVDGVKVARNDGDVAVAARVPVTVGGPNGKATLVDKYQYKFLLTPVAGVPSKPVETVPVLLQDTPQQDGYYVLSGRVAASELPLSTCDSNGICALSAYTVQAVLLDKNGKRFYKQIATEGTPYVVPPAPTSTDVGFDAVAASSATLVGLGQFFGTGVKHAAWGGVEQDLRCWFHITAVDATNAPLLDNAGNRVYDQRHEVQGSCPTTGSADAAARQTLTGLPQDTQYTVTFTEQLGEDARTVSTSAPGIFHTDKAREVIVPDPVVEPTPPVTIDPIEVPAASLLSDSPALLDSAAVTTPVAMVSAAHLLRQTVKLAGKRVALRLACPNEGGCAGTVAIQAQLATKTGKRRARSTTYKLAALLAAHRVAAKQAVRISTSTRFSLSHGQQATVRVKLSSQGIRLLQQAKGRLRAEVAFSSLKAASTAVESTQPIILTAAKRSKRH